MAGDKIIIKEQRRELLKWLYIEKKFRKDQEKNNKELERQKQISYNDELTGLWKRGFVFDRLAEYILQSERNGKPVSVGISDVNFFKDVNDNLGHEKGNELLQDLAIVMLYSLRPIDMLGRYGGDEGILVLPETDSKGANRVAERLTAGVKGYMEKLREETDPSGKEASVYSRVGLSCGTATYTPKGVKLEKSEAKEYAKTLISEADSNMFAQKRAMNAQQ